MERGQVARVYQASAAEHRRNRSHALMLAAICWKGDAAETTEILGLADDFLGYIEGDCEGQNPGIIDRIRGR